MGSCIGYEVDFHWPDAKLIVETDGRATHDNPVRLRARPPARPRPESSLDWEVIRDHLAPAPRRAGRIAALLRAKLGGL